MLGTLLAFLLMFLSATSAVLGQQMGYGYSQVQQGGFLNSPGGGCHSYYQGANYGPRLPNLLTHVVNAENVPGSVYKRELADQESAKRDEGGLSKRREHPSAMLWLYSDDYRLESARTRLPLLV